MQQQTEAQRTAAAILKEAVPNTELGRLLSKADKLVRDHRPEIMAAMTTLQQAIARAYVVKELRGALTDQVMDLFMELQGTALGFRTDKDTSGGYPKAVVRECVIEALLLGVHPIGNEFNIISGRCYLTKEGLARLVREFKGMTDLVHSPSVPKMANGGAVVTYTARYRINGAPVELTREIPVKVNDRMGVDAILGKATRKMLAAIYGQLTGSEHAIPDGEVDDPPAKDKPEATANARLAAVEAKPQYGTGDERAEPPADVLLPT